MCAWACAVCGELAVVRRWEGRWRQLISTTSKCGEDSQIKTNHSRTRNTKRGCRCVVNVRAPDAKIRVRQGRHTKRQLRSVGKVVDTLSLGSLEKLLSFILVPLFYFQNTYLFKKKKTLFPYFKYSFFNNWLLFHLHSLLSRSVQMAIGRARLCTSLWNEEEEYGIYLFKKITVGLEGGKKMERRNVDDL